MANWIALPPTPQNASTMVLQLGSGTVVNQLIDTIWYTTTAATLLTDIVLLFEPPHSQV